MTKSAGDMPTDTATKAARAADHGASGSPRGEIHIEIYGRTDVGQIREHNEDNFLIADLTLQNREPFDTSRRIVLGPRGHVLGVCDGMGGAAAGEIASQLAVDTIFEQMSSAEQPLRNHDDLARRLVRAVEMAGARIFHEAKVDRARRGMGTTSTIAALLDDHLFLAQVGDSRAYLLRGDRLVQVTRDQSLVNQLIEAGQLTEEEAESFEHNNIILQALGTSETVDVDLTYVELRRGDRLMLCSDGLSGMVRFDEIREVLRTSTPYQACKRLTDMANEAGGHDNITVVVAAFDGPGLLPPSPDDEEVRYRKYALPEPSRDSDPDRRRNITVRDLADSRPQPSLPPPSQSAERVDRVTDHGPSRSKLSNTMVGDALSESVAQALAEALAPRSEPPPSTPKPVTPPPVQIRTPLDEDEDIELPTNRSSWWVCALLALGALGLVALTATLLAD